MNAGRMQAKADALGEKRAALVRDQLMTAAVPHDVRLERVDDGICLIGKNLRRRMLDDTRLRNFGR